MLGVLVAISAVPLLAKLVPDTLPIAHAPAIDVRVLIFAGILTAVTGIGFGVFPALRAFGSAGHSGLRDGARAGGGRKKRARSVLVIAVVTGFAALFGSSGF